MAPYRVLVVDDSPFMRKIISDLIVKEKDFTVVATACTGVEAVQAAAEWLPDVMTLDLEMPEMNGLEALERIMVSSPLPIIMFSGISEDNTRQTITALHNGAFDFIRKPSLGNSMEILQIGEQLIEKLRIAVQTRKRFSENWKQTSGNPSAEIFKKANKETPAIKAPDEMDKRSVLKPEVKQPEAPRSHPFSRTKLDQSSAVGKKKEETVPDQRPAKEIKRLIAESKTETAAAKEKPKPASTRKTDAGAIPSNRASAQNMPDFTPSVEAMNSRFAAAPVKGTSGATTFQHLVAIGTSTGGPRALHSVITSLPENFPAPVLVVQHMPPKFTRSLAQRLDQFSKVGVTEASDGERLEAGKVYIAPGGKHMRMGRDALGYFITLTSDELVSGHRPSVDALFQSLVPYQELKRHAVIMTGMGSDGAKGMKALVESGAITTIAESEETCIVYGMPRCAVENGSAKLILPVQEIASRLVLETKKA